MREAVISLANTDAGRKVLTATGYKGFQAPNAEVEATTITWLGL